MVEVYDGDEPAAAARLCYSNASIRQLLERAPEQAPKLLRKILDMGLV